MDHRSSGHISCNHFWLCTKANLEHFADPWIFAQGFYQDGQLSIAAAAAAAVTAADGGGGNCVPEYLAVGRSVQLPSCVLRTYRHFLGLELCVVGCVDQNFAYDSRFELLADYQRRCKHFAAVGH